MQALARFQDRSLLMGSLRALAPADLATLSSDPAGSHVMQALITLSSDKGRGKILRRMEVGDQPRPSMVTSFSQAIPPRVTCPLPSATPIRGHMS